MKKKKSSKINGKNWKRPHLRKISFFVKSFPEKLEDNEWKFKFALKSKTIIKKRVSFYNPDFFCPTLDCYIEVVTSKPNISEQGWKWRESIKLGLKLRVFWWKGKEITEEIRNGSPPHTFIF